MEFLDEFESRPRFVLQSKQVPHSSDSDQQLHSTSFISSLHKPSLVISLSFSTLIFFIAFFYFDDIEPLKSLLLWLATSLLLGPFAPSSITAGDIRVGIGPPLKEIPDEEVPVETREKSRKSSRKSPQLNPPEAALRSDVFVEKSFSDSKVTKASKNNGEETKYDGERDWTDVDEDLLRKFMAKHPVGKPGRWEAISEGFKGKHKVESVIQRAKEMGERKVSDQDSYQKFLKDRKPVDHRALDEVNNETSTNQNMDDGKKDGGWSAAEDLALLNALKTFPKEVTMRWEKIAAALPGKTKAACMKRVTHLKKDFRSSKAGQPS